MGVRLAGMDHPAARAWIDDLDGRLVCRFEISGGPHAGALGPREGAIVSEALRQASSTGRPVLGVLDTAGADIREGVAALAAWGAIARTLTRLSGQVPIVLILDGPCVSGPALLLGIADVVIMTTDAFAYLSGPAAVRSFTGIDVDRVALGGADRHDTTTGVAAMVTADRGEAIEVAAHVMSYLPDSNLEDPPDGPTDDPPQRPCDAAAATLPDRASAGYDVRDVLDDILDTESLFELRARYAPNMVTALGRIDGRSVGIVANQPLTRAGTLDIEASRKAARFVSFCDAFNLPILTFVDTPGFEPGRDLEWRGMIRHGAQLVHSYCAASVPRLCVILRKSYGGAYIVMDSRGIGSDLCLAWPTAEIAVMGAAGAVQILHGRRLAAVDDSPARASEEAALIADYESAFLNPYRAAERGLVDAVIEPTTTRRVLADALDILASKRDRQASRKHANSPL